MKTFPQSNVEIHVNKNRKTLKVVLKAKTVCGPNISAEHQIKLLTLETLEIGSGTQLCKVTAHEKLKDKAKRVAAFCIKEHDHKV